MSFRQGQDKACKSVREQVVSQAKLVVIKVGSDVLAQRGEGKCQLVLQPDNSPDTSTVGMVLDFIRRVSHNRRRENETKTKVSTARWLTAEMEGEVM